MHITSKQPSERRPARMAPLSVLPVFLDLCGKKAVVAGGSDAAAWKAELLAAAGATVHVYAPAGAIGAELARLMSCDETCHSYVHHDEDWSAGCFIGASLAVADAASDAEAQAFEAAARLAGVPCNVIDRPSFCQFQFGSIVNRSPIVVGISTSGAAPILGQAVRRRIETLLPPSLADWAGLARKIREVVMAKLSPGARRRALWEAFVDRAFGTAPSPSEMHGLAGQVERLAADSARSPGRVTFVGAGPGDAELLTLKAVRALQAADVILFDDLVSDGVLELARREAKRILVGKRGGRPSCRQDDINDMMVKLARSGRHVVRLKSGDPMVFGRAGEEIDRLRAEEIEFDVVPGITSGLAMASALGVSLTHRDHARSVRFVTGHSKNGGLPDDLDWRAIADSATTTIFYMSGRTAGQIAERLTALGMRPETPAAIASALGRPAQTLRRSAVRDLAESVAEIDLREPLVIGIGTVFAERQAVDDGLERASSAF